MLSSAALFASTGAEQVAVATDRALLLPAQVGPARLPWHRVASVSWDADTSTLSITEVAGRGSPAVVHRVRLAEPGLLAETVRERVTASIVVSQHVPLVGRLGARIVARRIGSQDELSWQLLFDAGLDPGDGQVRARAEAALADLRARMGI